jgi:hypothetical protein
MVPIDAFIDSICATSSGSTFAASSSCLLRIAVTAVLICAISATGSVASARTRAPAIAAGIAVAASAVVPASMASAVLCFMGAS